MDAPPPLKTRKPVYGRACASSSQPLASSAALQILSRGGNAVDAAIAMAAMLSVTEPCSNGIGGDLIALHHVASTPAHSKTTAILGNGASPAALTPQHFDPWPLPSTSAHAVTVPGAVAAWIDMHARFGSHRISFADLLAPAIQAAEMGFPVAPTTAYYWRRAEPLLRSSVNGHVYLVGTPPTRAPRAGEVFRNPDLARVLRGISQHGRAAFYEGAVASAIVTMLAGLGGVMKLDDLARHRTTFADTVSTTFRGYTVHEVGAPTHGAVALMALNLVEGVESREDIRVGGMSPQSWHVMIEALRVAYSEAASCIADPAFAPDRTTELASKARAAEINKIDLERKQQLVGEEEVSNGGTVQFCVIDGDGMAVSAVQSNYQGFGSGHVPDGCGFTLQNRGLNFCTTRGHGNCVGGGKKSYHTIMPGIATGPATAAFGVMGSFMQPQGHVQVMCGLTAGLDTQQMVDRPRFRVTGAFSRIEANMGDDAVLVEADVGEEVTRGLRARGHDVRVGRLEDFGRGHVCVRRGGIVEAAADSRADGVAVAML